MSNTRAECRPATSAQTGPTTAERGPILDGHAQLIFGHLKRRRGSLAEYNPAALKGAAVELAAMHRAGYGKASKVRADRKIRYRLRQFMGQKCFGVEEWWAVKDEGADGLAIARESLRVRAAAIGEQLFPIAEPGQEVVGTLMQLVAQLGRVVAEGGDALRDNQVDAGERERIDQAVRTAKDLIARYEASR